MAVASLKPHAPSLHRALTMLAAALAASVVSVSAQAARDPVLKQVDLPHSYYWREMYIPQPTPQPSAAAFSPDGASVVYSMAGSLWRQTIGSDEATELTHGPGYDLQPDWSSDGWIVFVRYHDDAIELWRLDVESGEQTALTHSGAVNLEPRFSPDGKRLVFVSTEDSGHFNLFIAGVDEKGLLDVRPLIAPRTSTLDRYYYSASDHAINPSWSPDGTRILHVGNPEVAWGSGDLWSVSVENPEDRKLVLSEETTWAARPELSPDGKRLLFSSYHGRQWHQLWLTTPEGKSPLPLTFGDFDRRYARWSPDGERVLYVSNETGSPSLWVQEVAGGERRQIVPRIRHAQRPMAKLSIALRDERGQAFPGRVMVLSDDERFYAPDDAWLHGDDTFDRALQKQENRYFHCSGTCALTVPVGNVKVWAMRGLARVPVEQSLDIPAEGRELPIVLAPQALPASFGEFTSADLHVHMNYGGQYRQRLQGLAAQAQAEDLDVVYELIVNKEERVPDLTEFTPQPQTFGSTTIYVGQEFHTSYWGHMGLLHLDDHLVLPDFTSYRHTALASPYPYNGVIADLAHRQHALVGYVHPYDLPPNPERDPTLTHTLPVDVALGKIDYVEIVSFADHRATAEVWYRLLNLGFHIAAGAGTDAMTDYASLRGPVGLNRVYLATKERTPAALGAALKEGHSFVTNGPLLGLTVDGYKPGDTVRLKSGQRRVRVDAAVRSIAPLSDVELIFNGRVLKRLTTDASGRIVNFDGQVAVPGSGWLLLRAANVAPQRLVQDLYPYGTTNPVWIDNGSPPPAAVDDARYFVRWIDRIIEAAGARSDYNSDRERERTLRYLRDGRAQFEGKLEGKSNAK